MQLYDSSSERVHRSSSNDSACVLLVYIDNMCTLLVPIDDLFQVIQSTPQTRMKETHDK